MIAFATTLLVVSASIWVGAIVFQVAVVAPTVFVDLSDAAARSFLRRVFPRFFRLGLLCGAFMLCGAIWIAAAGGWTNAARFLIAATVAMLGLAASSLWMIPHINAARDAGPANERRFARLHRISVLLTLVILTLGIGVLAMIAVLAAAGV